MTVSIKPVIYQLVVRYFGNTSTANQRDGGLAVNGCGRFADINTAALSSIKSLGATHVWLTGCFRQATLTDYSSLGMAADDPDIVKGIAGSFYAVRDYFDVCPDYATNPANRMDEFEALVQRVHQSQLKVVLDLVPNHVARSYHSVIRPQCDFGVGDDQTKFFFRDNHFFYLPGQQLRLTRPQRWNPQGIQFDGKFAPEDGGPARTPKATGDNCASASPTSDNWYETVKINYGFNFLDGSRQFQPRPRTWNLLNEILAFWQAKGVDGFRCDMAHYVPLEAWRYLLGNARDRDPEAFFFAEAYPGYGPAVPVANLDDLIASGFNAYYHSDAYNALKRIYQGRGSQDGYDATISSLSGSQRSARVGYLENHDERRIASPIDSSKSEGDSGFGTAEAGYQLAPLQFLFSNGPLVFFNGQEVGEPGAGKEGFSSNDGRTTTFDYWCMPEFAKWVNAHAYDGGGLSQSQKSLRRYYAELLALCQDSSVRGGGYWGLKYFNRSGRFPDCPDDLYSFARFEDASARLLLVVANFRPNSQLDARVRIPGACASLINLADRVTVRLVLDRCGAKDMLVGEQTRHDLVDNGFSVSLPNQTAQVYGIE